MREFCRPSAGEAASGQCRCRWQRLRWRVDIARSQSPGNNCSVLPPPSTRVVADSASRKRYAAPAIDFRSCRPALIRDQVGGGGGVSHGPRPTSNVGDDMKDRLLEDSLRHCGDLRMSRPALSSVPAARCCKTLPERWWRRAPLRGKVFLRLRPAGPRPMIWSRSLDA